MPRSRVAYPPEFRQKMVELVHAGRSPEELALYQFNTKTAKHYFCRHCGVHPFARPRIDPSRWVVNVRCIDGVDLSSLPVRKFDGEHWEEAAKAFLAAARRAPA